MELADGAPGASAESESQQGRIDVQPADSASKAAGADDASKVAGKKRVVSMRDDDPEIAQDAQPAASQSDAKKVRNGVSSMHLTPQQSAAGGAQQEAGPAASAAPLSAFGALATKGGSGFAFGGTSAAGSGFGSVAFGGKPFNAAAQPSLASKASKDGRASPSEMSNAGSAAAAFGTNMFGAASDAHTGPERAVRVFGATAAQDDKQDWDVDQSNSPDSVPPAAEPGEVQNGEHDESAVFSCNASLFHFDKGADKPGWKARGVGALRVNMLPNGQSRLVMRQLQTLRLQLNAWLFPELRLHRHEGAVQVSFTCVNAAHASTQAMSSSGAPAASDSGAAAQATGEAATGAQHGTGAATAVAATAGEQGGTVGTAGAADTTAQASHTGEAPPEADAAAAATQMGMYAIKFGSLQKAEEFERAVDKHKHLQAQSEHVTEQACEQHDAVARSVSFA